MAVTADASINMAHTIELYGEIGGEEDDGGVSIQCFLDQYRMAGNVDLEVRINTLGGDYETGFLIYRTLKDHPAKVTTVNMGMALSMGAFLMQAGDERIATSTSIFMLHRAQSIALGDSNEMLEIAGKLELFDKEMIKVYAERTGKPEAEIISALDAESWFNSDTALAFGLVDSVRMDLPKLLAPSNSIEFIAKNYSKAPGFVITNLLTHKTEVDMTPEQQAAFAAVIAEAVSNSIKPLLDALAVKNAAPEPEPAPVVDVAAEIKNAMAEVNAPLVAVLQKLATTPHNMTAIPNAFGSEGFVHEGELL